MGLRLATRCRGYPGALVKMTAPSLHGGAETHLPTSKPRLLTSTPWTRLNRPRFLPLLCGFGLSVDGLVVDRLEPRCFIGLVSVGSRRGCRRLAADFGSRV